MLRTAALILIAVLGTASFTVGAFAADNGDDLPPSCAGGSVPVGTLHCPLPGTGGSCTEGAPWKCEQKATTVQGTVGQGDGTGHGRFHFGNVGAVNGGLTVQGSFGGNSFHHNTSKNFQGNLVFAR